MGATGCTAMPRYPCAYERGHLHLITAEDEDESLAVAGSASCLAGIAHEEGLEEVRPAAGTMLLKVLLQHAREVDSDEDEHEVCFDVEHLRWGDGRDERLTRLTAAAVACSQGKADIDGLRAVILDAEAAGVGGPRLEAAKRALEARTAREGEAQGASPGPMQGVVRVCREVQ
mmetsp:Transcript_88080/g.245185  ORF Transcript_88080/g.245185 Transcript_88080/m.245185 type:complete len:173 (+) Transcript_88080:50-568(+)